MKSIVDRKDFDEGIKAVKKVAGNIEECFLETKNDHLRIIANTDNQFMYKILSEDTDEGFAKLKTSVLSGLGKMREEKISIIKVTNTLKVNCGSDVKMFCIDIKDGEFASLRPDKSFKKAVIKSSNIGVFKSLIKVISFDSKDNIDDSLDDVPVILNNTNGKFSIYIADVQHSVFYILDKPLFDKSFKVLTYFKSIKNIASLMIDATTFYVNKDSTKFFINSSNFFVKMPILQEGDSYIQNALTFMNKKSNFYNGSLVFNRDEFRTIIDSMGVIKDKIDALNVKVKKNNANLDIKSVFGKSKDSVKLMKNTLGNKEFSIPLLMFEDVLNATSGDATITFKLAKNANIYKIQSIDKSKGIKVVCLAPIIKKESNKKVRKG